MKEVHAMQLGRTIARSTLPLLMAAFIAAGCEGSNAFGGIPDNAVCSVDGTAIRTAEFDRMFSNAEQQYADNGREFPEKGSDEFDSLRSDLVEYLVQQKLILNQADKFGIKATRTEINKGVEDLKEQVAQGDEEKFTEEMERVNYTIELVERDVEFDIISRKLYERIVKDITISDADARKYFKDNSEQFTKQESREIAHILVQTKGEADEIYAEVRDGDEDRFAELAKEKTLDPSSKDTGGVLPGGSVQRGQTVPEFDKTAFELKTGEVSQPVKTDYGWHVIAARGDVEPESKQDFDEVKDDIKQQMKGEQEGERYTEYNTDVRKDAVDSVRCREGFVWRETVTETEETPAPAAVEPDEATDEDAEAEAEGEDADADAGDDAPEADADADAEDAGDDQ
jgi:foldase protein PrsA